MFSTFISLQLSSTSKDLLLKIPPWTRVNCQYLFVSVELILARFVRRDVKPLCTKDAMLVTSGGAAVGSLSARCWVLSVRTSGAVALRVESVSSMAHHVGTPATSSYTTDTKHGGPGEASRGQTNPFYCFICHQFLVRLGRNES